MAFSYVTYTGDGTNRVFSVTFPYLDSSHVKVSVNGTDVGFTFLNGTTVQTVSAPANGSTVKVYRSTSATVRMVDYADGSTLTEANLDTDSLQAFYLIQEVADSVSNSIASGVSTFNSRAGTVTLTSADVLTALLASSVPLADALKNARALNLSGDVTAQIANFDGSADRSGTATIANNAVTNAKLADMAQNFIKGRVSAGPGDPEDLTATQVTALLNVFTSTLKGLVPPPTTVSGKFLKDDGTWGSVSPLPSQTGNARKVLTTDGTNASWAGFAIAASALYTDNAGTFTQQFSNGVTLTRPSTGNYTLTLSTPASAANSWGFVVLAGPGGGNGAIATELYSTNRTASSAKFETRNIAGSLTNSESIFVLVYVNS